LDKEFDIDQNDNKIWKPIRNSSRRLTKNTLLGWRVPMMLKNLPNVYWNEEMFE
jgi:hypothetical protein